MNNEQGNLLIIFIASIFIWHYLANAICIQMAATQANTHTHTAGIFEDAIIQWLAQLGVVGWCVCVCACATTFVCIMYLAG